MTIDKKMHEQTQYKIPYLKEQIHDAKNRVGTFVIDCNEKNWDSYNGLMITVKTIKFAAQVLDTVGIWFEKNIGFLNNRSFNIFTCPSCNEDIHIEINYDENFEIDLSVKYGSLIDCHMHTMFRIQLDGTRTIADRDFPLLHSKDAVTRKCKIEQIADFLNDGFYSHKWKFEISKKN
jgi:hypothetical protein